MSKTKEKMAQQQEQPDQKALCPVPLTDLKKIELGNKLAQDEIELDALITENKSTNATFRENKAEIQERIKKSSTALQDGVEYLKRDIVVEMNHPADGLKTIYIVPEDEDNTVELIFWKEEEMTEDEKNNLFGQNNDEE